LALLNLGMKQGLDAWNYGSIHLAFQQRLEIQYSQRH